MPEKIAGPSGEWGAGQKQDGTNTSILKGIDFNKALLQNEKLDVEMDLEGAAVAACEEIGLQFRHVPQDGEFHRLDVAGKAARNGDGTLKLFLDGEGGLIENHVTGEKRLFWARPDSTLSPVELAARKARNVEEAAKAAEHREARYRDAAAKAVEVISSSLPASTRNPYLTRKGIAPNPAMGEIDAGDLAKVLGYQPKSKGWKLVGTILVLPVGNKEGISSIEMIDGEGRKTALTGGKRSGMFWHDRELPDGDGKGVVILIAEGAATAISGAAAIPGSYGVAAFGKGNLKAVALDMRKHYPAADIVILSDLGDGQKDAEQAAAAAGCRVATPTMPDGIDGKDWNDLHQAAGLEEVRRQITLAQSVAGIRETGETIDSIIGRAMAQLTREEMLSAKLTPRVIVPGLLYADVRTRISAGGTGKTTAALYEAAILALGRDIWGKRPEYPCRTAIVTREDGRGILLARLREIMRAMRLSPREEDHVLAAIRIVDLSGAAFRLSEVVGDVVYPHGANLETLISHLRDWRPDWVIFDPLVSFGVGESRVNDAEQGLIEAFRIIRNELDCCVEGIHHTGKANARDKSLDQYSGRGGSALSDGCRMVAVMQPLEAHEWVKMTGTPLGDDETGIVLALPKLSYAKPQEPVYIRRNGYHFAAVEPVDRTPEQQHRQADETILMFLRDEYAAGRQYSQKDIESMKDDLRMTRGGIRGALVRLKAGGRIVYHEILGKSGSHYQPLTLADDDGETHKKNEVAVDESE